jgi:hypothetical protein
MKKISASLAVAFIGMMGLLPSVESKEIPCPEWRPTGELKKIPFYYDCSMTNGDIGVARSDGIYWCKEVEDRVERKFPGASHFYFVHEYGHYVKGSDEGETDCWAAQQLAGTCYINIAVNHLMTYADEYKPRHGYMRDRAIRIRKCAGQ